MNQVNENKIKTLSLNTEIALVAFLWGLNFSVWLREYKTNTHSLLLNKSLTSLTLSFVENLDIKLDFFSLNISLILSLFTSIFLFESFKLSSDKLKLDASISSHNGDVRLWKDGKEDEPIDAKNPYWMEIRIQDAEGKPTKVFPLKGGFVEMQLPKSLLERNPKSLTLHWIDFYRNWIER